MTHRLDAALGVALLFSLGLNGLLLLHSAPIAASPQRAPGAEDPPTPRKIPCPPRSLATAQVAAQPTSSRFDGETRDPEWATAQEAAIESHIADMVHEPMEVSVECRSRCCSISGDGVLSASFMQDLQASAGLMPWAESLSFADRVVACFDRAKGKRPPTELARRRKEILDALSSRLDRCARLTTVPLEVTIMAGFEADGHLVGSVRQGELSGSEAARCAEKAVARAATFPRQPTAFGIPFTIRLDPDSSPSR